MAVQHHHAHIASCMAEHGLNETVIGVAFDGTGFGTDGTIWGGEFLLADLCGFRRAAHLRPVHLPGGDQAIREPWRSAAAHLVDCNGDLELLSRFASPAARRTVGQMIERRFNSVRTSSAGRLFDAIAALAGVRGRVTYEGQATMELEWLATDLPPLPPYPFGLEGPTEDAAAEELPALVIDTRPMIAVRDRRREPRRRCAAHRAAISFNGRRVHRSVCQRLRQENGIDPVVHERRRLHECTCLLSEVSRATAGRWLLPSIVIAAFPPTMAA